jgi:preprotein translocase subunit SecG
MELIVLIIHLMIAIALVGVILMQQSEGGALGLGGGGGGMSGFLTGRAAANILTRMTTILGAGFIATSMLLAILAGNSAQPTRPQGAQQPPANSQPATPPKAPAAPK